ncbi:unnamed protein product [Onchocerca flexuosa]|uniref:Uncharacterized protein n=1 Tax=Onchocerca flexuosa TaxID=387005 RepID=A0A183H159_9BILA|nr:unnamed protein product [Onchocerca flexuosa]
MREENRTLHLRMSTEQKMMVAVNQFHNPININVYIEIETTKNKRDGAPRKEKEEIIRAVDRGGEEVKRTTFFSSP